MTTAMTMDRLKRILEAYGADSARWPDDERAAARLLLVNSAEAQEALADARALDAALDAAHVHVPGDAEDAALTRLLAAASPTAPIPLRPRVAALHRRPTPAAGWAANLARAAMLAVAVALGAAVGYAVEPATANGDDLAALDGALALDLLPGEGAVR